MTIFQGMESYPLVARIERLAAEWRLPVEWIAGACRAAGIPCELPIEALPGEARVDSILELAEDMRAWQHEYLSFVPGDPTPPAAPPALRLRQLYRAIYCDVDDMRHILMLMAAQHLRLFGPDAGPALAGEMLYVFVPVAEMLGMYCVRRAWIEQCMHILKTKDYGEKAGEMGITLAEATPEHIEDDVRRQQEACPVPPPGADMPRMKSESLGIADRWHLFTRLREQLQEAFRLEWDDESSPPQATLVPSLPGRILFKQMKAKSTDSSQPQQGESELADSPQLTVRIICRTRGDCYRALGAVHRIFPPVGSGQGAALRDYIGAPRANGYRVLQTLCLWTHPIPNKGSVLRIVSFRIMTEEMHDMNEWGILAERNSRTAYDGRPAPWWKRLDTSLRGLTKRSDETDTDIAGYLRRHAPGAPADPIYCFTPLGTIHWLHEGDTALDFAHRVHSQLLHHTRQILINGKAGRRDTPLQNGDLVEVVYDPTQSRADFCWQAEVKSKRAQTRIRKALRDHAAAVHPGRRVFIETLIKRMDRYDGRRPDRVYTVPAISTQEIDLHIQRAAVKYCNGNREALYGRMVSEPQLVDKLAHRLISEKIIPALRWSGDRPADPNLSRIDLCIQCRPIPTDNDIEGRLSHKEILVIHRTGCGRISPKSPRIELEWAPEESPDDWPLYRFEINTRDSKGVLNNILRLVYDTPRAYLFSLEATVSAPSRAIIEMEIAVKLPQLCRDLQRQLESTPDTRVSYESQMRNRRGRDVRPDDMWRLLAIPFTESEVIDSRFYGRDEIINDILGWVDGLPYRSQTLLIHGQRRVGKSSLVKRLAGRDLVESPDRKVVPVVVDFRSVSLNQPHTVAELLVQQIFSKIGVPVPRREAHEDPFVWLDRQLLDAERRLSDRRLLIIIDEFDADFTYERVIGPDWLPLALQKLRAIIDSHPDIRWMLVIQTVYLADPLLEAALPELPVDVPRIAVGYLWPEVARRFIMDLSTQRGLQFAPAPAGTPDLPDQIVTLTAGNLYFINVLCYNLLQRVERERRGRIEPRDLERSVGELLSRPRLFDHLYQALSPVRQQVVADLARNIPIGRRQPAREILDDMILRLGFSPKETEDHIALLVKIGVLERVGSADQREIGIPVQLLHRWLQAH